MLTHNTIDVNTQKLALLSHTMMSAAPCRNFLSTGTCDYGSRCRFSHDTATRRDRPPPGQTPCFHWEKSGACPYRDRCAYLHRPRASDSTKRTFEDLCEKIHTFGVVDSTRCDEEIVKSDFQEIASYDWVAASVPTIGIPGSYSSARFDNTTDRDRKPKEIDTRRNAAHITAGFHCFRADVGE